MTFDTFVGWYLCFSSRLPGIAGGTHQHTISSSRRLSSTLLRRWTRRCGTWKRG